MDNEKRDAEHLGSSDCSSFSVCNGQPLPCGCNAFFSSGNGEYSDSITVVLCRKHRLPSDPKKDANLAGYWMVGDGSWKKL